MQSGYSYELSLVDAKLCDVLISLHILCSPLFDSGPRIKIKHLKKKQLLTSLGLSCGHTLPSKCTFAPTLHINSLIYLFPEVM